MKTLFQNPSRPTKSTLSVVAVVLTLLAADQAAAGLRGTVVVEKDLGPATVRVRLQTPDTVIHHRPPVRVRTTYPALRVSPYDRDVAYRLSVMTGAPELPMLHKRARGVAWNRIARVHGISKRDLRIATSPARFARWLDRNTIGHGHPGTYAYGHCDDHGYDHDRDHGRDYGKGHGKGHGKGRGR